MKVLLLTLLSIVITSHIYASNFSNTINDRYAYISDASLNGYAQCEISSESGIMMDSCTAHSNTKLFMDAYHVLVHNKFAYFPNTEDNSYTQCNIGNNGIDENSCKIVKPSRLGALSYPENIAFFESYAYFVNNNYPESKGSYTQCHISSNGIEEKTCLTNTIESQFGDLKAISYPQEIGINGNYIYFVNWEDFQGDFTYITQCHINAAGNVQKDSCTWNFSLPLQSINSITFHENMAYLAAGNGYTQCNVNDRSGIIYNTCKYYKLKTFLDSKTVGFSGNFAYIPNSYYTKQGLYHGIYKCKLSDGNLVDCEENSFPEIGVVDPYDIAFSN